MKKSIFVLFLIMISFVCCHVNKDVKYVPKKVLKISNETIVNNLKESTVAIIRYNEEENENYISCSGVWLSQ